jgi:hypothetical protein
MTLGVPIGGRSPSKGFACSGVLDLSGNPAAGSSKVRIPRMCFKADSRLFDHLDGTVFRRDQWQIHFHDLKTGLSVKRVGKGKHKGHTQNQR